MIIGCLTEGRGAQHLTSCVKACGFVGDKGGERSSASGGFCSSQTVCCSTQLMTADSVEPYFVLIWKEHINSELSSCSVVWFPLPHSSLFSQQVTEAKHYLFGCLIMIIAVLYSSLPWCFVWTQGKCHPKSALL